MRRYSVLLSSAAILLALLVTYTYVHRSARQAQHPPRPIVRVETGVQALATTWHYGKDDPQTNCPIVRAVASSFRAVHEPSTFELTDLHLKLFNKGCSAYTYVQTSKADFDEYSGVMTSKGGVLIIMKVPGDKEPEDKQATAGLVHIKTSGAQYDTKTGKVNTDQPASFEFSNGKGHSVGAAYDPNTHQLHMKSQVALDWIGNGPPEDAMHIEAGDLRYDEITQKVFLTPWSRLSRRNMVINATGSEITQDEGVLKQVDSLNAKGTDDEDGRHVEYGGGKLIALFNDNGEMTQITAQPNAYLLSEASGSRTSVNANQAVLHFDIKTETVKGQERDSSVLHEALARGNAVIDSSPIPGASPTPADTRVLRSDAIDILMKAGGREIDSLRTQAPGQLEFKPNQAGRSHRWMDAERINVIYGDQNAIGSVYATKVATRTIKPLPPEKNHDKDGKRPAPPAPALTWSDELNAKFKPKSNELATMEQKGNFRYEEGERHAVAAKANLEQLTNKITLNDDAKVWDNNGATSADTILLDQSNGDMDAVGRVASTRQPDQQAGKQNSSLLDQKQPLQARSDHMTTRDNNLQVDYEGNAVLWQGANRIQADLVHIDRDEETLNASGHVISQLVEQHSNNDKADQNSAPKTSGGPAEGKVRLQPVVEKTESPEKPADTKPVVYTIVRAPKLAYEDEHRVAHYTGGVELVHDKTTVTSKELTSFLTKDDDNGGDGGTSLDHAFADGDVKVVQTVAGRTRTGTSEHCEYYPKENKVILNGGLAKMLDSRKGTTAGRQLTYYSNSDHVLVEGAPKHPVLSEMKRGK